MTTWIRQHRDAAAIGLLILLTSLAVGLRWYYDNWMTDFDIFTFFLPNWTYLGTRLRDFDIPGWNPFFSSGTPFAGDPSGGWMYLPVMVSFTLFNTVTAVKVMVLLQALIGGIATYLFSRRIGLSPMPALIAGLSLASGPALYGATYFTTVGAQITALIPVGLLCVEAALQAERRSAWIGWSAGAGVAIAQMFASWPGQGLLYGVAIIGGWMLWRWLVEPTSEPGSRTTHLRKLIGIGLVLSAVTVIFGAAGILPRLDFNNLSNIPGGDYSNVLGGTYSESASPPVRTLQAMLQDGYIMRPYGYGTTIVILTVFAIVMMRRRFGIGFFTIILALCLDLTASSSITRPILGLIPGFEHIHGHRPVATLWIMSIAPSMLAGAACHMLLHGFRRRANLLFRILPLIVFLAGAWYVERSGYPLGRMPYTIAALTSLIILWSALPMPRRIPKLRERRPALMSVGLLLLVISYPTLTDAVRTVNDPESGIDPAGWAFVRTLGKDDPTQDIIDTVLGVRDPDGAAEFLLTQQDASDPFRYVAYAGIAYPYPDSYSQRRMEPGIVAVLANGRSSILGLEQVAGYNPTHLKYYAEYVTAMNGVEQDYHWLDVYSQAIQGSTLLNMLNVRYILVDATIPANRGDVVRLSDSMTEVYRDNLVIVYENPSAFDRAWIVHDVRPDTGNVLFDLENGVVDGQTTAFVSGDIPATSGGDGSQPDAVTITSQSPESMSIDVTANGDGLLVLSEPYEHNWRAWVDGEEVDILRTNHALRGIPVSSGSHQIELKYQPRSLQIGLWSTGLGSIALVGIWTWATLDRRRNRDLPQTKETPTR